MEVAGLVLGIAGLFSVCTEILEQYTSYKEFGISSSQLRARFEAEKLKLKEWADLVGIQGGVLIDPHHPRLDDHGVRAVVYQVLCSIIELFPNAEKSLSGTHRSIKDTGNETTRVSRTTRIKWAFGSESKAIRQVEALEELVSKLYYLVPPSKLGDDSNSALTDTSSKDLQLLSTIQLDLQRLVERNQLKAILEDKQALIEHLKPPPTSEDFANSLDKHLGDTCEWIFTLPDFKEWIADTSNRLLWIYGAAGSGKTILCSRIVSYVQNLPNQNCFYFFCTTHAQSQGNPEEIVRSWLVSICTIDPAMLQHCLEQVFQNSGKTSIDVWSLFRQIVPQHSVFVVDGIDEYTSIDQRRAFINKLKQALGGTTSAVSKILILSRDQADIRHAIEEPQERLNISSYKISEVDTAADIDLFSRSIIKKTLGSKEIQFQDQIAQTLAQRSQGMFLWITLTGQHLRSGLSKARILNTVETIPKGLSSVYERNWKLILEQPQYERTRALKILKWCAFGLRPLKLTELTAALVVGSTGIDIDDLPDDVDDDYVKGEIVDICSSLVETRSTESAETEPTVHLVHFSVTDFLLQVAPGSTEADFRAECHCELAILCLQYLCDELIVESSSYLKDAFLLYALRNWDLHVKISNLENQLLSDLAYQFIQKKTNKFVRWSQSHLEPELPRPLGPCPHPNQIPALYYAASLNLRPLTQQLLKTNIVDLDAGGRFTPLQATCWHGNRDAFDSLIQNGADVNSLACGNTSALHMAAVQDRIYMIQELIRHDAILDLLDFRDSTALCQAAMSGHKEATKLLLEHGAKVSNADNALHKAAYEGYIEIIRYLISYGASVNQQDHHPSTPLYRAADAGREDVVQLLLEQSADPSIPSMKGWKPLHVAAAKGHLSIVKMLLEWGDDITAITNGGWTPLFAAADKGRTSVVRFLLEKGAPVSPVNESQTTPLQWAAGDGNTDIVRLLLDHGAGDYRDGSEAAIALYNASTTGHIDILKMLIAHGVPASGAFENGYTPLHGACIERKHEAVRVLLQAPSTNIDQLDDQDASALWYAAKFGELAIVQELITHGADIYVEQPGFELTAFECAASLDHFQVAEYILKQDPAQIVRTDKEGSTPLFAAIKWDRRATVEFLLGLRPDLANTPCHDMSPLTWAFFQRSLPCAKVLLKQGADVECLTPSGKLLLHIAVSHGRVKMVRMLLEHGAKVNARDKDGFNALMLATLLNELEIVRKLTLQPDIDVLAQTNDGRSVLHLAACKGNLAIAELLVAMKARTTTSTNAGVTVLHAAVLGRNSKLVRLILDNGGIAMINHSEALGQTPLHFASRKDDANMVKLLLDAGAEVNAVDTAGQTSVNVASASGHLDIVETLLAHGADLRPDYKQRSPLDSAVKTGCFKIVQALTDAGANVNCQDRREWTPLHVACYYVTYGQLEIIEFLLASGAELGARTDHGDTPLFVAARKGNLQAVKLLISKGATIEARTNDNKTPFIAAVLSDHLDVVEYLIDHGANVNQISNRECTALYSAASEDKLEMVHLLLRKGADYSIPSEATGQLPVSIAATKGHGHVVAALIDAGAPASRDIAVHAKAWDSDLVGLVQWEQ